MGQLGDLLRQSREQLGLSLEEVEATTRIKRPYLEALEGDRFDALPNPVAARGFIRNYASVLRLDPEYLLELFDQASGRGSEGRRRTGGDRVQLKSIPITPPPRFSADLFVGVLLIFALLGTVLYFVYQQYLLPLEMAPPGSSPLATSEAAITLPTPTLPPTDTPMPTVTPTPPFYTGVTLELVISDESWIQVLVDEVKAFEGILQAGERRHWTGDRQVAVRAGNAGGVEVIVNGESMGVMGGAHQVVDQVWEKVDTLSTPSQSIPVDTPTVTPGP